MARAEALLPHPAAAAIPIVAIPMDGLPMDLSRGEPWSDHQTDDPKRVRYEVMAAGLSPVAFFFLRQSNINRR